jgi:hypothetical protein
MTPMTSPRLTRSPPYKRAVALIHDQRVALCQRELSRYDMGKRSFPKIYSRR